MDPNLLVKYAKYNLEFIPGQVMEVMYSHETINHYVFDNGTELMPLTPAMVNQYIEPLKTEEYAKEME